MARMTPDGLPKRGWCLLGLLLATGAAQAFGYSSARLDGPVFVDSCPLSCQIAEHELPILRSELRQLAARVAQLETRATSTAGRQVYIPAPRRPQRSRENGRVQLTTHQELQLIWQQLDDLYLVVDRLRQAISR